MRVLLALMLTATIVATANFQGQPPASKGPPNSRDKTVQGPLPKSDGTSDPAQSAGLAAGVTPIVIGWDAAYRLALSRAEGGRGQADPAGFLKAGAKLTDAEFARLRAAMVSARDDDAGPDFRDPLREMVDCLRRLHAVDARRRRVASLESHRALLAAYGGGTPSGSGVSRIELARLEADMSEARRDLLAATLSFRDALDALKARLGLPPRTPIVADPAALDGFRRVFDDLDLWAAKDDHGYEELSGILGRLPRPPDVVIAGRSFRQAVDRDADSGAAIIATATRGIRNDEAAFLARQHLRSLAVVGRTYDAEQARQKLLLMKGDDVLQRIISPPAAANPGLSGDSGRNAGGAFTMTRGLTRILGEQGDSRGRIVSTWLDALVLRHAVDRDLDTLARTREEFLSGLGSTTPAPGK